MTFAVSTNWGQVRGAKKGDYIYIYLAKPYSAILYKCQITNINIPYKFENENLKITKAMEMKVLERYGEKEYQFSKLKEYGVNFFRGSVKMPTGLRKEMNVN